MEGGLTAMEEPNYWTRWAKRRLSRRRLLKGAAGVGAGLAGRLGRGLRRRR